MSATVAATSPDLTAAARIPGLPFVGSLLAFRRDSLGFFDRAREVYGELVQVQLGPHTCFMAARPEHFQHVLVDRRDNYSKQTRGYNMLRLLLGNGLLTSEGEFWLRQRRIAQPAFHRQRIESFVTTMRRCTEEMLADWRRPSRIPSALQRPRDVHHEMMALTLRIAGHTLLSTEVSDDTERIGAALTYGMRYFRKKLTGALLAPESWPTLANRRFRKAAQDLDDVVLQIIAERRQSGDTETHGDLLDMLMAARDEETGEGMSDQQLRDEVLTIFMAGHETTAAALTWTFYLLSKHPEVEAKLLEEVRRVRPSGPIEAGDLRELRYTEQVVNESMRLYPPAWMIGRKAEDEDVIGSTRIPREAYVFLSPWSLHHNPRIWREPSAFRPERFEPEAVAGRDRYAFAPFGGGPRLCIGNNFALMEMKLVLATVLREQRVEIAPRHVPKIAPSITLRPADPMPFHPRRR